MRKIIQKEKIKFINHLFSVDGCQQLWLRNKHGVFKQVFFCKSKDFLNNVNNFAINSSCDYYIVKNPMYADGRGNVCLRALENIVIDIDNHNLDCASVNYEVSKLCYLLSEDYSDDFPVYAFKVCTGRGVQLWIHIDSLAPSLIWLYKIVLKQLCDRLSDIIKNNDINLEIDYTASLNASGLVRLPFSFNSKNGYYIDSAEPNNYITYSIDDLIEEYGLENREERKANIADEVIKENEEYKNLHIKRMKYIENLDKNCKGRRNNILFCYYNTCIKAMEHSKAASMTENLNKSFLEPLEDLQYIYDYIDKKGHLKMKNATFLSFINADEEERKKYKAMSEYKPKINKVERNKKIMQLAVQRMTCQQIADEVGCSERTVRTVLKNFDKSKFLAIQVKHLYSDRTMTQQQIADILKISERQVRRYLKE